MNLADVYKFKKTIELDASKAEVYTRIVDILKLKYNLKNFALYEVNNVTNERKLFHLLLMMKHLICQEKVNKDCFRV